MIKPLEQTSYIMLNDKEIMFIVGSSNVGKSTYLAKEAYYASKKHKVLYFSLEMNKEQLFKLYSEQRLSNENLTIIDKAPLIVEDIESYIKEDTDYIYIDYFNLIDSSKMFENGVDKAKYILDKLKDYTEQHNVKFLIMNNQDSNSTIEEAKEFYTSNTYTNVDCVWVLLEDKMTRIK